MPQWMRQIQSTQQGPGAYGVGPWPGAPGGQQGPAGGYAGAPPPATFSVGSLVSEEALPQWMRSAGDGSGAPAPHGAQPGFGGPAASQWGQAAPPAVGAGGWGPPAANPAAQGWGGPPPASPPPAAQPFQGSGFAAPGSLNGSALFDDAALPEWLRNAAADQSMGGTPAYAPNPQQPGMSGGFPSPQQPPSMFMPTGWNAQPPSMQAGQAGGYGGPSVGMREPIAPGSMPAQSLLDVSALPTWLGGSGAAQAPAGPAMALGGDGLSAQSLIDERSLPVWLRQEPATPAVEPPPAGSISQWLAAPVTDEPLPTWLNQVYAAAQVPRIEAEAPLNEPWTASHAAVPAGNPPAWYRPVAAPGAMPVGHLTDDRAMPSWQAGPLGPPSPPPGVSPEPTSGFGAPAPFGSFGASGMGTFGGGPQESPGSRSFGGWGGDLNAPSAPAFGAGAPAQSNAGSADDVVAAFSASDLIDPDALPAWVQREAAHEEPTFNSATGWTSKGRSMDAGGMAPVGAPAGPMSTPFQANGPLLPPGRDLGEANLPPWLQQATPVAGFPERGSPSGAGRNPGRGGIPDAQLPPWLRGPGGGGAGAGPGGYPMGAPQPQAWGSPNAGYAAPQPYGSAGYDPAWDGPMAAPPPDDGPAQHYADLFADERPDVSRRFSYDVDHSPEAAYRDARGRQAEADWDEPQRGKGRRRWFGKR